MGRHRAGIMKNQVAPRAKSPRRFGVISLGSGNGCLPNLGSPRHSCIPLVFVTHLISGDAVSLVKSSVFSERALRYRRPTIPTATIRADNGSQDRQMFWH